MNTIKNIKEFKPELLDLVMKDPQFCLFYGDSELRTEGGEAISYENERLLKHLLVELSLMKSFDHGSLCNYIIFSLQKDFIESGKDPLLENINDILKEDFFVSLKLQGKRKSKGFDMGNILDYFIENTYILNLIFLGVASVQNSINRFFPESENKESMHEELNEYVKQTYIELSAEKRAVVNALTVYHDAGLMLPLLLVNDSISATEYSNALFAIQINRKMDKIRHASFNEICSERITDHINYPDWERPSESFDIVHKQALDSLEYLSYFSDSDKKFSGLAELINKGESYNLEFKSTLRWNIKAERKDPAIEHASLKTITAFLNSSGGILLIGVQDDGSILGTELDKFENEDRYLLHLWNLIKSSMGQDIGQFIDVSVEKHDGKQLIKIVCSRSSRPVFLKQKGFGEEFFIRLGPSSASLDISEALKYISDRFSEKK
jgi:hypothetical protein